MKFNDKHTHTHQYINADMHSQQKNKSPPVPIQNHQCSWHKKQDNITVNEIQRQTQTHQYINADMHNHAQPAKKTNPTYNSNNHTYNSNSHSDQAALPMGWDRHFANCPTIQQGLKAPRVALKSLLKFMAQRQNTNSPFQKDGLL